jgi:hypothetical protein
MELPTRRRVSMIALAASVVLLAGCAQLTPTQGSMSATPDADASERATVDPREAPPGAAEALRRAPADLSFETGVDLDPAEWRVQWFTFGDGFSEVSADDGNGNWSILDDATQCTIRFYQGTIAGIDYGQDDRTVTDDLLFVITGAIVEGAVREDVTTYAFDDAVPLFLDRGELLPMRTIWGTGEDGSSWLYSARMFGSMGGGVYLAINCPAGQDAGEEFTKLRDEESLVIDVGPFTAG